MLFLGLVSKDKALCEAILEQLNKSAPWQAAVFEDPAGALAAWQNLPPPLVLFDTEGWPENEARDFLADLQKFADAPWILSIGHEAPGDDDPADWLEKPLRLGRLLARLRFYKGLLQKPPETQHRLGSFSFLPRRRLLLAPEAQEEIKLTDKETALLEYLVEAPGFVREELLEQVWGYGARVDTHTLETHIYRLRRKLKTQEGGQNDCFMTDRGRYGLNPAWRAV